MNGTPFKMGRPLLLVLALTWQIARVESQDTAALIIAGLSDEEVDEGGTPLSTASVELFGCPDRAQDSYPVEDYPFRNYFSASIFRDDYALSCGGFSCERETCDGSTDKCFSWRPRDGNENQWQNHSVMYEKNWNFIIAEGPDLDSDDTSTMTMITIGPSRNTQIYNLNDETWRFYRLLPESTLTSWAAHRCVVQVGTDVYHIDEKIYKLDLLDWEIDDLGPVPVALVGPSRCTSQTIYGRPGILLKNGFWYDIERYIWEERAFPPDSNFLMESPPNEYSFRGMMTIFGNPYCDSEGYCEYQDVVQYNEADDVWTSIGQMHLQREILDVVEVPVEWCDDILGPSAGTTSVDDTTPDPSTTDEPLPGEGTDNVAMIVGGVNALLSGEIVPSVELFGCPGYDGQSVPIQDYPLNIYATGGAYFEDEDYVLVCGGMDCQDGSQGMGCTQTTECYTYKHDNGWESFNSLNRPKWQHIVASVVNINEESGAYYPAVIGNDMATEIYNPLNSAWEEYEQLPESNWRTTDCLVQHGDFLYNIRNVFTKFDTTTWTYEELDLPFFLRRSNTCAMVRVNGFNGLMLKSGYWYSFESNIWEAALFPPYPTFTAEPDSLFSYRGHPTIFGNPTCNSEGECKGLDVIQYDPDDNAWYNIGEMIHERRLHTVIEVPKSFCVEADPPPARTDTAAILIGGATNIELGDDALPGGQDGNGEALTTVEIFGCPQAASSTIRLEDFPTHITSAGGVYYPDGEHVIVCGGRPCDENEFFCEPHNLCYQWTPETGWEDASEGNLDLPRFAHKMVLASDRTAGTSARVPLVLGGTGPMVNGDNNGPNVATEIYDPDSGWKNYLVLQYATWNTFGCLTAYNDDVYAITPSGVVALHTASWSYDEYGGETPEFLLPVTKCSPVIIDGQLGIMLRNGYWFNLNTEEWEAKKFPPNNPFVSEADAMHYFRGEPTVFGSPVCNSEGHCYYTEVIQYNPNHDQWDSIGTISESKQFHEVVEVPREICDRIAAAATTVSTSTSTESTVSTTEVVTDPYVAPDTSTVAMIIGGNWGEATRLQTMSSVELFGCPDYEDRSFPLLDFPSGVYLSGATYFQNNQDVGKVVACGGFQCADGAIEEETCELSKRCFEWTLDSGEWEETPSLNGSKWSHLMALVQNLDNVIDVNGEQVVVDELVPMVLGRDKYTEIYNTSSRGWMPYRDIPGVTEDWVTVNCLIQIDDNIYHIANRFYELNTIDWEITDEYDVPSFLQQPGMCSQARVRDIEGILLTNGYWFNLQTKQWEQLRFPPFPEFLEFETENLMMYSFRGMPTVFNMPTCDSEGECIFNDVVQYNSLYDRWESIGTMLHHRGFSSIVEVPQEYCEVARYETPSRRTAAIVLGGVSNPDEPAQGENVLQSVELIGCPRSISIPLEDFPERIYLTAGIHFVLDEVDDPLGKVVVCGGFTTSLENRCWELDPATMSWSEADYTLGGPRWAHEMYLAADTTSGSNKRVPMVLGGQNRNTEIWDPIAEEWKNYNQLPLAQGDYWTAMECTVVYQDVVYHIRRHLYSLDLFNWELTDYGAVPAFTRQPGRCQVADIDGIPGIMIKNGYWFNLESLEWEAKRFPPNPPFVQDLTDALYSFRGAPTFFGSPVCDENGECEYREVLWYDSDRDYYVSLGNMNEQRFNHEVIEVPDSFCELVETVDPTTEDPFTGSTAEAPPEPEVDNDSVALIIGGHFNHPRGGVAIAAAELFGCEDSVDPETGEYIGKPIDDTPVPIYITGGIYYEQEGIDDEDNGKAVVCGGFGCPEGTPSCLASTSCYKWTPANQWEPFEADLNNSKWGHIMVTAPRIGGSSDERVPIVLGQNKATEIFNPETSEWESYQDLEVSNWNAIQCLVQYGDRVYQIGGGTSSEFVYELDLITWTTTEVGDKLDFSRFPGTCAIATIDDVPGIMIGNGYWFNLLERTWESKTFPPYFDGGLQPNSLANFRGKATLFNSHQCDENAQCDYIAVYQYEDSSDQWRYLGRTVHSRTLHEIIEVPKTFCDVVTSPPPSTDTAAMIIGGVGELSPGSRRDILESVELFGCPGQDSFLIEPYPKSLYLHAGNYFDSLERDQNETTGSVLVCGGFVCEDPVADDPCGNSPECYVWNLEQKWDLWPALLPEDKWAFIMASAVDMYSGSNTEVPLILGEGKETYAYDYITGEWQDYDILEMRNWFSLQCLVQHEETIYHIQTEIHALNTLTWETRMVGEVPETLANYPGRCAISVINGQTGILVRNGFWFNLETETWEAKRFPPHITIDEEPNALFSYQGRPTMFGSPVCDGEGNCEYKEVLQYNENTDTWNSLGMMVEGRQLHYIVEVPNFFCDEYSNLQEKQASKFSSVDNGELQQDDTDTVAMIVGGFWDIDIGNGNQLQVIPEVELFGCPDSPDSSKILQDYPENVYLSGGRYFEDMDMVISCGGYSCQDIRCTIINDCFQWTPENQWEPFTSNLNFDKWSHIMTEVVNLDGDGETLVPMVLGQNSHTEIWNPNNNVWETYRELEGYNWASMSCLFQEGDYIYHMRRDIERLDTKTWTMELLGEVPEFLEQPGKCAYLEANGTPGILLRNGYWYNIEDNSWQQQRFPPYANVAPEPDAVWKFRGKPTVFGSTVCEGDGTCIYTGIEQYDLNTNTWVHLGRMTQTRVFHDVIEVPASFCDFEENPLLPTSSAAMIVGGVEANFTNNNPEIFSSVEIFGCPGEESTIPGPDFPLNAFFTGGIYYSEDGTVENGAVIVCGGFGCPDETCNLLDVCYEWNPLNSDEWVEAEPLTEAKWGHLMTTAPDVDSTSNREMPLIVGLTEDTQIRDFDTDEWREYKPLPDGSDLWLSFGCLVRYRYKIYHIREEVFELDTLYWEVNNLGPIPEFMANNGAGPGRCAITEIDNEVGIMLQNGFFYQLNDRTWHQMKFPPHIHARIGQPSDALHTFRGKPTYFGAPTCDGEVVCRYTEILQYQDRNFDWIKLGNMVESRRNHEIIEIPAEYCQTGQTTTTTTQAPATTNNPPDDQIDTVAMIIGGAAEGDAGAGILSSVELYGCPSMGASSILLGDFPVPLYLTAGVYYADEDKVVVCGGNQCEDLSNPRDCQTSRTCYEYEPASGVWSKQPSQLINVKWAHFMGLIDFDQNRRVPIVLGYGEETEIYNPEAEAWEEYTDLEENNWTSMYCLIQVGNSVWHIRMGIYELDLESWEITEYQSLPEQLENSGHCSYLEIDGQPGIFLKNGYWFNIQTTTWEQRRFPPFPSFYQEPNALFSFRDRPTLFGNPMCEEDGSCTYKEVIQYNVNTDMWNTIGEMQHARGFHTVVEVPVSFCDRLDTTTTTTTSTTTRTTTTKTTTTTTEPITTTTTDGDINPTDTTTEDPDDPPTTTQGTGLASASAILLAILLSAVVTLN